jgi:hypothetical protein
MITTGQSSTKHSPTAAATPALPCAVMSRRSWPPGESLSITRWRSMLSTVQCWSCWPRFEKLAAWESMCSASTIAASRVSLSRQRPFPISSAGMQPA